MGEAGFSRMRRVDSIVKEVIASEVEQLKDPRLDMVTVTGVETAPNLRRATVYFSCLDLELSDEAAAALESARPRLRRLLGSEIRMKYTPELEFVLDEGVVGGARIDALLRDIADHPHEAESNPTATNTAATDTVATGTAATGTAATNTAATDTAATGTGTECGEEESA